MWNDTIAAIATPLGEGGIAVIRISGPQALTIADACFQGTKILRPSQVKTHTVHYGHIYHAGISIDEVLLIVMHAPRTYTKEDMVEINCHGGILVAKMVLDTVLAQGARLAQPGEFTKRAFLNGRIDLTQAEAVADIIRAQTDRALTLAHEQLAGKLSQQINLLRDKLMQTLAHIEAHLDFPEEDIQTHTQAVLQTQFAEGIQTIERMLDTAAEGQILRKGVRVAIIGRPNTGKSSLLNQLLGHNRAIVSPTPGTTRDTITETANIRGIPIIFVDTAGLRDSSCEIEQEGVRRTLESINQAELLLHVLDQSNSWTNNDAQLIQNYPDKKRLLVLNKQDLEAHLVIPETILWPRVSISCINGSGLELLRDKIAEMVTGGKGLADMTQVMINSRHENALRRAQDALKKALALMQQQFDLPCIAFELRLAVNAVGEIVGKTATDDLLDIVFSQFCIGK